MKPWLRSADRALPYRPLRIASGAVIALGVAALIALLFAAIAAAAATQPPASSSRYDLAYLLWITTLQASLSTVLSLCVGIALAWSLNRLRFPGRAVAVALFASAIVTPGIIVAFGLLSVWGRNGWVSRASEAIIGIPLDVPIFGLGGVVTAHVILDGAFAARILLARLDAIPSDRLKTGQSLALSAGRRFAVIDWPAMRSTLPGLGAVIFLLAFTSFPIVLLLGGGPAIQTLEVAIYSAVRLDFDLNAAIALALVQMAICAAIVLVSAAFTPVPASLAQSAPSRWRDARSARALQWLVLILSLVGFALPLLAVLGDGLQGVLALFERTSFRIAALTSLGIASTSSILALVLALAIAASRAAVGNPGLRIALGVPAYAYLAVPAVALSLGAFLFVRQIGVAPEIAAPVVVIIANALLALPFALATLGPAFDAVTRTRGKLMRAIGLTGTRQFTAVEWQLLAGDIGIVVALAFCFSLGDLGVIALFGTQDFVTLPLYMLRALGAYRTNDAAGVAALMLLLTITAFVAIPLLFERLARART